jgi:hypothetical protein
VSHQSGLAEREGNEYANGVKRDQAGNARLERPDQCRGDGSQQNDPSGKRKPVTSV